MAQLQFYVINFLFGAFGGVRWVFVEAQGLSLVAAHGLRYPAALRILVPQPGIKPSHPALEGNS